MVKRDVLSRAMYGAGRFFFSSVFALVWRRRLQGRHHVPVTGPLILAANHASFADPPLVGSSVPRPIFFMAKEELFRIPFFGWVLRKVNAFPIRRKEGDVGAFRTAQRILASGGAMIMFPEGKRQRGGLLGRPKSGVGFLAAKTRAPVVPVYVNNTHRIWRGARVGVSFGPPLVAGEDETADEFSRRVMERIAALKEEAGDA